MPDLPGDPVKLLLNLSGPMATCGDVTLAMLPEEVAPADAVSLIKTSLIFIILFIKIPLPYPSSEIIWNFRFWFKKTDMFE